MYIMWGDDNNLVKIKIFTEGIKMANLKSVIRIFDKISDLMRIRIFGTFVTVGMVFLLLVGVSFAAVFVVYEYPTSTSGMGAKIYLEKGPNYANAQKLGLVSGGNSLSPTSGSGTTIGINTVAGSNSVFLLNVFEVVNKSSGIAGHVYLYINGTLPIGVTLYYDNTTQMNFTGTDTGSYSIIQGLAPGNGTLLGGGSNSPFSAKIPLTESFTLYLAFELTGKASGAGILYMQTSIG